MEERHTVPLDAMGPEALRRLELRAAQHDRSVEDEAVAILITAVEPFESAGAYFDQLRAKYGTVDDIPIPPRSDPPARWANFSE
jgi:plasmid stability protein